MPNYPLCSLHDIRKLLNQVFDDPGLDAFCLDYFTEIYDQFSRGMQKEEKLTLLLRYYRSSKRFKELLQIIYNYDHPEFKAFFAEKGIHLDPVKPLRTDSHSIIPTYEAGLVHNFDMTELVTECLDFLIIQQGLIGFVLPYNYPLFLTHFCERLKQEWGRGRVQLKPLLKVDPILMPINRTILTINRHYKPALNQKDVLFAVELTEASYLTSFWEQLRQLVAGEKLPHHFIVIIATSAVEALPDDLILLGKPRFRKAHIHHWIKHVIESFAWPDEIVQIWIEQMITECNHENELQIEWVYVHLEEMINLLRQNPTIDEFKQELERRRYYYA